MSIKIVGNIPEIKRVILDLPSFDRAFGNRKGDIGFPIGTVTEVAGPTGCGKSTSIYGLSGMLASKIRCDISLADFEGFDPKFLHTVLEMSGFDGELNYIQEIEDETSLDTLVASVRDKKTNYGIGILDSIGAISPIAEADGDLGEANMGRRAKLMAQFARKTVKVLREAKLSKTFFLINHLHPIMGSRGLATPGGETVKYLSALRIRLKRKEEFPDGSYVLEGKVVKNRFGFRDRIFHLFVLSGKGIHQGMTWMYDGFINETIKRGRTVKIGDLSMGRPGDILKHAGDDEFFLPFREAVYSGQQTEKEIDDDIEVEDEDTE
jgi:RecA/RadA recombinase